MADSEWNEEETGGETVRKPFTFRRFVNGQEKAEGVRIELADTLEQAMIRACRLCPEKGTVLVYDGDSEETDNGK
jgi:hypothetical protein